MTDPAALAQDLIRCPSVTPDDAGALGILERVLGEKGFICHRLTFAEPGTAPVENLYARLGTDTPNFCFAGHTDVVPPGDDKLWRHPPFAAEIDGGVLYGRGAADMKSSIAAFVAALHGFTPTGSISLLITGDEEGPGINGTQAVLAWLKARGEVLDHCLVGEPTATAAAGDTIKIGRRGSLTAVVTVTGRQGHVGYPRKAINPIPALATLIDRLSAPLDEGTAHFDASTLSFTTVDVGNRAGNVIPAEARAQFNIRFNDLHSADSLMAHVRAIADGVTRETGTAIDLNFTVGGHVFLTRPGAFVTLLSDAVAQITGTAPELSTTGGTSDARFIKDHCPVAEIGLPGGTMHMADECVPVAEIHTLAKIYREILQAYFQNPPR